MHAFECPAKDGRYNDVFNQAMYNHTTIVMQKILEVYTGFKEITEIIDVVGGTGATVAKIIAKYPQIRGINFDLPHVIKNAAPLPEIRGGAQHDEQCLKLLKNCCKALPEFGKVVVVESVVPEYTNTGSSLKLSNVMDIDMVMIVINPGGKDRSLKEFEALAKEFGFAAFELICSAAVYSVLEFQKKV
ncbi:O-methyltransferase COMT-type [Heracleum sosnowskyi]|uniref:O-methyltransferase COMT-type n=1 Tax=Heracleum sosnowskyi TaxID=360622 RepID=A0AAD8GNZ3_9APIA|nr:O-methyltransferase COMT-type [Heracleum sosnowskyi]